MSLDDFADSDLLTVPEAAPYLRMSAWTLYKNKEALGIPIIRINGAVRIRVGALRRWLADRESESLSGAAS